jgi:DNA-binding transcriptional MerR regulator
MEKLLPPIPPKRYFTIGEVSELCGVKPYVLRYWEQEFTQLRPMKRRGNRRYYQHHEVLLIRRIRDLLYEQGFTISGARNRLTELGSAGQVSAAMLEDEDGQMSLPDVIEGEPISPADIEASQLTLDEVRVLAAPLEKTAAIPPDTECQPAVSASPLAGSGPLDEAALLAAGGVGSLRSALLSIRELLDPY